MTQLVIRFVVDSDEYDTYLIVIDSLNDAFGKEGWHWPHSAFTQSADGALPKLKMPLLSQPIVVKDHGIADPLSALREFR